jgi:very-short-patch-repair endonuclease
MIIELDGQHHYSAEGIAKDIERDQHLAMMDKKVLRFENKEVLKNLIGVLERIKAEFKEN